MLEYCKYRYVCFTIIFSFFLVFSSVFSDEVKTASEKNDEYYQNLLQVFNLISFSLNHIYSNFGDLIVEAEYSNVLNNINFDEVPLPDEIEAVYQEIINTISKLRPNKEIMLKTENNIDNHYAVSLRYEITGAISQTKNRNIKYIPTLMKCSRNLYFALLLNYIPTSFESAHRQKEYQEARNIIMGLIGEWRRVIELYFNNQILPRQPSVYLIKDKDIVMLLKNFYLPNTEVCLESFNDLQNTQKKITQIPIFWLLYAFSADRALRREQAELCINKFFECYKSILKKDIFLEVAYIRKLESLLWKNPEFQDTNINQEILTTAETACKYIDDKNVIYKIYLSAIFHKLGKPEKTQELLLGINPEMVKSKSDIVEGFYKLAIYDWEHGNDIYKRMKQLAKIWENNIISIKDMEELKEVKIPDILFRLGRSYLYQEKSSDNEKGIAYIEEAHQLGLREATYYLADIYTKNYFWLKSKVKKDEKKGFEYYKQLAEKGDKSALAEIGRFYYDGRVVPKDFAKAKEYFEEAKLFGGEYWLGVMYSRGDGVPQDYQKAYEHFLNGIQNGQGFYTYDTYIALGDLHFAGKIDVVNYIKAMEYYQKASDFPEAQVRMAYIYENGYEFQKSYTKAKEYYEKAGKYGHLEALLRLGDYYLYGLAGKKDYVLSYAYYTLVIRLAKEDSDHPNAQELDQQAEQARKKLLPRIWNLWSGLTPEEVKEAEDLANSWKYGSFLTKKGT